MNTLISAQSYHVTVTPKTEKVTIQINELGKDAAALAQEAASHADSIKDTVANYAELAEQWAVNPVDEPVEYGKFSCLHYYSKTRDLIQEATLDAQEIIDRANEVASNTTVVRSNYNDIQVLFATIQNIQNNVDQLTITIGGYNDASLVNAESAAADAASAAASAASASASQAIATAAEAGVEADALAAETAKDDAETAASSAASSASSAAASATDAQASFDAIGSAVTDASDFADAAAASASAAETSRSNAFTLANQALTSEMNAAASEVAASGHASAAATSASNAATSEANAAASAANISTAETNAQASEDAAAASALAASGSADDAAASATAASGSATAAAASQSNAFTSQNNALTSEMNAAGSAVDAGDSATVAANAATAAAGSASAAQTSADAANSSAISAANDASSASVDADAANTSAGVAGGYSTDAYNYSELSRRWASENIGVEVTVGKYSALHYADAAATSATAAASDASVASTSASNAASSESNAATSAINASNSASSASGSASAAATSASNAATSESNAATSASDADASATSIGNAETNAAASAAAALASSNAAATSESNAGTSETNAANSASSASGSASAAATSASNAATSESNAATSESNASGSAAAALASENAAATSETNAATSASDAATSASNLSDAETNAAASAAAAAASATSAGTSATNAATSASSASGSASAAATSASNAATSESNASGSATAASGSASSASGSASAASTSAGNASSSASAASTSAANAAASEAKAMDWAEEDEDVEIETGRYSAKHWAQKAAVGAVGVDWGTIAGTLSLQTDLQNALDGKSATGHGHAITDTTGLQTALNGKSDTGHGHAIADTTGLTTALAGKSDTGHTHSYEPANTNIQSHISSTANPHGVTKTQVGLGNVDNTSDANKPISTATSTALAGKAATSHTHSYEPANTNIQSHIGSTANPHSVTASQVGLGNVNNTSDANKPISTATQTALNGKSDTGHTHSYDNYGSWTARDHDGTSYTVTSGDILQFQEGTGIDVNFTADDVLTITNTAPHVGTNISVTENASTVSLYSSTGTDDSIAAATTSLAGVMTAADKTKLNGIATGAQVNVATNITVAEAATNVAINSSTGSNDTIAAATTSLAGVMSAADKTKLDGIATGANNYSHPGHPGDSISIDTGALTGATVISDLDFNVTTDTLGHVTDANAAIVTRNLTAANIGAAAASHSHTASNVSDFATAVSGNSAVAANTAKRSYPTTDEAKLDSLDLTQTVSAAAASVTLNATIYDSFYLSGFNQNITLDINMAVGRTITVFLYNPGAYTITWDIDATSKYWAGGAVVTPDATGITVVTITKVSTAVAIVSAQTGYTAV